MGFCGNCGSSLAADDKFCGVCGSSADAFRSPPAEDSAPKPHTTASTIGSAPETPIADAPEAIPQDPAGPATGGEVGWWDLAQGGQGMGHQPEIPRGAEPTTVVEVGEPLPGLGYVENPPDPATRIDDWRLDPPPVAYSSDLPAPHAGGALPEWPPPSSSPASPVLDVGMTETDHAPRRRGGRIVLAVVASMALLAAVGIGAYRAVAGEWPAASLISGEASATSTPPAAAPPVSVPPSVGTSTPTPTESETAASPTPSPLETASEAPTPTAEPGIVAPAQDSLVGSAVFAHFVISVTGNRQIDPSRPEAGVDVDVRVCLTSLTEDSVKGRTRLSWDPWSATTSFGAELDPAAATVDLAGSYPRESRVTPSECREGTLRFVPPAGAGPVVAVTYSNGQGDAQTFEALP